MTIFKYIKAVILDCFISQMPYIMANVNISATLDSAVLLMGKQTTIHLEIVQDISQNGYLLNEPLKSDSISYITEGIEFNGIIRNDTANIDNLRKQINRDYLIQSFDSGLYTIPPFKYVIGVDTFKTTPLTLKVVPFNVDSIYETITDYSPIEDINRKWYDFIPDSITDNWIIILVCLIIILGTIAIIYLLKNKKSIFVQPKIIIPPYDLALQRLNNLKSQKLCENGQEREYYTIITEILREYLAGRFEIYAMEMTSTQILDSLNKNDETRISKKHMHLILEMADFVKFAKVRPLPDDNIKTYHAALQFIEETKPKAETDESSESNK